MKEIRPTNWELFQMHEDATLQDYLTIIDDGLCFGFEFKVEDHKIYFRDKQ